MTGYIRALRDTIVSSRDPGNGVKRSKTLILSARKVVIFVTHAAKMKTFDIKIVFARGVNII